MPVRIHLLTNPKFLGDKNQALGINTLLEKKCIAETSEWDDSDPVKLDQLKNLLIADTQTQHIIIAIGDHGLQALKQLNHVSCKNILTVYASHQIFPELENLLHHIDILALPSHVIDASIRESLTKPHLQLVSTLGVAHNLNLHELDNAYTTWQNTASAAIATKDHYIGVILGGDAPEPDGTMRYFSAEEATALALFLCDLYQQNKQSTLLITNSPRTGKFNPVSHIEQKVHAGNTVDETSKALLQVLDLHNVPYQFFDFVAGKASAYKPILAALQKNINNIAIVTGDSTSMVTEMTDILPNNACYVIDVGSMNASHQAHVRSVQKAGIAQIVTLENGVYHGLPFNTSASSTSHQTAAESIAIAIQTHLLALTTAPVVSVDALSSQNKLSPTEMTLIDNLLFRQEENGHL